MWAKQLLGSYQGILQVDAWQAYDQFGKDDGADTGVTKSYCWAHLRRGFVDAGSDAPVAQDALQRIAEIYGIGSATSDAMKYALKRWAGFTRFLDDGRIEIDNNTAERAIRPVTLQRKNALFTGHQLGAENWAAISSLVETCKMLDINPYAYLCDVLTRIITRADTDPIDDLLPYCWTDANAAQTSFELSSIASAA